ncbi:hypothetical protein [Enterococcus sp. AZ152]|uniref:hypothetical protein n=1 Tax=Enterococcus sp. AZ152 TaxID=2774848 RepID=UPI003F255AA3
MKKILMFFVGSLVGFGVNYFFQGSKNVNESKYEKEISNLLEENEQLSLDVFRYQKEYQKEKRKNEEKQENLTNHEEDVNYQSYQKIVTKAFEVLFTFTPEDFSERREKIGQYFSSDLFEEFFDSEGTYENSNGVSSRINQLSIYNRTIQENTLDGMVVVDYESSRDGGDWWKSTAFYQISYDVSEKKIISFQSLGSVIKGDDIE